MKILISCIFCFFFVSCCLIDSIYRTEISPNRWRYTYTDHSIFLVDTPAQKMYLEIDRYRWENRDLIIQFSKYDSTQQKIVKRQSIIRDAREKYKILTLRRFLSHFKGQKTTNQYKEIKKIENGLQEEKTRK